MNGENRHVISLARIRPVPIRPRVVAFDAREGTAPRLLSETSSVDPTTSTDVGQPAHGTNTNAEI
jgi:hypothetical protein